MLKNIFFSLAIIFYSLVYSSSFATQLTELEEVSINSPNRFGFNSLIVSISLEGVEDGPHDKNFSLAPAPKVPVIVKGRMKFYEDYQYIYEGNDEKGPSVVPFDTYIQGIIKDRITTYGIARLTFDSFQKCCKQLNINNLDNLEVLLNPEAQIRKLGIRNAYYERKGLPGRGVIQLCSQTDKFQPVPVTSFFDIASHETGHSILDILNGKFYGRASAPSAAFHEAFADLSVFFASVRLVQLISQEQYLKLFTHTLASEKFNICVAFELNDFGYCLRNPWDTAASCKAHDHSKSFTNFYLTSMSKVFKTYPLTTENALWVTEYFQTLLIKSIVSIDKFESLYKLATHIIEQVPTLNYPLLAEPGIKHIQEILYSTLNAYLLPLRACNSNQSLSPTFFPTFGLNRRGSPTSINESNIQLSSRFNNIGLNEDTQSSSSVSPPALHHNSYPTFESFLINGKDISLYEIQQLRMQGIRLEHKYGLFYAEWAKHYA